MPVMMHGNQSRDSIPIMHRSIPAPPQPQVHNNCPELQSMETDQAAQDNSTTATTPSYLHAYKHCNTSFLTMYGLVAHQIIY